MKSGGIVNLHKLNSFAFFRKNKLYLFLCLSFLIGILIGSISLYTHSFASTYADGVFNEFISSRRNTGFLTLLISRFLRYGLICLALYISGTSLIGVILSPIMCCSLGIYYGIISSFACSNYALKGVAFNAIILIPTTIVFALCMFFSAKEAFCFSILIIKLILPKSRPMNIAGEFKLYCGHFVALLGFVLISSAVDSAVSLFFLGIFPF